MPSPEIISFDLISKVLFKANLRFSFRCFFSVVIEARAVELNLNRMCVNSAIVQNNETKATTKKKEKKKKEGIQNIEWAINSKFGYCKWLF